MEVDDVISSDEASSMEINLDQSSSESEMNTDSSEQSVSDEDEDQTVADNFIISLTIINQLKNKFQSIQQKLVANIEVQEENDRLLKIKKEFEERKRAIQRLSKKNARPMTIDQFMGPFGYPYFGSDFLGNFSQNILTNSAKMFILISFRQMGKPFGRCFPEHEGHRMGRFHPRSKRVFQRGRAADRR